MFIIALFFKSATENILDVGYSTAKWIKDLRGIYTVIYRSIYKITLAVMEENADDFHRLKSVCVCLF